MRSMMTKTLTCATAHAFSYRPRLDNSCHVLHSDQRVLMMMAWRRQAYPAGWQYPLRQYYAVCNIISDFITESLNNCS